MAISEQLDLISKEIGGTLDDNGSIEKQVQEIYDIIKSGKWPSGGGGGEPYTLPTASADTKGGVKIRTDGWLEMNGENLDLARKSYKKGIGYFGPYDSSGWISNSSTEVDVDRDAWIVLELQSAVSYVIPYTVKIYDEEEEEYYPIISNVMPAQYNGTIMCPFPCYEGQTFMVDTNYGPMTVNYKVYRMKHSNAMIN